MITLEYNLNLRQWFIEFDGTRLCLRGNSPICHRRAMTYFNDMREPSVVENLWTVQSSFQAVAYFTELRSILEHTELEAQTVEAIYDSVVLGILSEGARAIMLSSVLA